MYRNIISNILNHSEKESIDFNIDETAYKILTDLSTVNFSLSYTYYKYRSIFDVFKSYNKDNDFKERTIENKTGLFPNHIFQLSKIETEKVKLLKRNQFLYNIASACTTVTALVMLISGILFAHAIFGNNSSYKSSQTLLKKALFASSISTGLINLMRTIIDNRLTKAETEVFKEVANNLSIKIK